MSEKKLNTREEKLAFVTELQQAVYNVNGLLLTAAREGIRVDLTVRQQETVGDRVAQHVINIQVYEELLTRFRPGL